MSKDPSVDMWNDRFGEPGFAYGTEPNDFLKSVAHRIPAGPVLCIAEGQGRNAVFLAGLGHDVTAVDLSPVGLARAAELARARGVKLRTVAADLNEFRIEPDAWSGIVAISAHLPSELRRKVHGAAARGLKPGGAFVLECYGPGQLKLQTGGPKSLDLLPTIEDLKLSFAGFDFAIARSLEREVVEGKYHTGKAHVNQLLAIRRPAHG